MKKLVQLVLLLVVVLNTAMAQQMSLTIDNQTPGWLSSKINYGDQKSVKRFKVTGYINATDLLFIGTLIEKQSLNGRDGHLDLSEVNIVGDKQYDDDVLEINAFGLSSYHSDTLKLGYLSLPLSLKESKNAFGYMMVDTLEVGGTSMHVIHPSMFGGSPGLEDKYIPEGHGKNRNVRNLIVREGVDSVIEQSFNDSHYGINMLQTVSLPSTLRYVGDYAFTRCKLSKYNLPDSVEYIGQKAFSGTGTTVDTLRLPAKLERIYLNAFSEYGGYLNSKVVYFGPAVKYVHNLFGNDCVLYGDVEMHMLTKTPPAIETGSTYRFDKVTLYVPKGTSEAYKKSSWKNCKQIIEEVPVERIAVKGKGNMYVGETTYATATIYPINAINKNVQWSSSDTAVATISDKGEVHAIAFGKAEISAKSEDGGFSASYMLNVFEKTTKIELPDSVEVAVDGKKTVAVIVYPRGRVDKQIIWKSSDNDIAYVNGGGIVWGVGKGVCQITATTVDNGLSASCKVVVVQPVTGVSLDKHELQMNVGETTKLTATVRPDDASRKDVVWMSENNEVASVSSAGVVSALKAGEAKIVAKAADDNSILDYCAVTVKQSVTGLEISDKEIVLTSIGDSHKLTAMVMPEDASNKEVRWSAGNASVAFVSDNGTVVAVGEGETVVIATTVDGGFASTCKVVVNTKAGGVDENELANLSISTTRGEISVQCQLTKDIVVYNVSGMVVYRGRDEQIFLESGIYVIMVEGHRVKVVI